MKNRCLSPTLWRMNKESERWENVEVRWENVERIFRKFEKIKTEND